MVRIVRIVFAVACISGLLVAPYWYHQSQERHFRNFRVVHPGVVYRSGQLDRYGFAKVLHDYGIRTVINLRAHQDEPTEIAGDWEEEYCGKQSIAYVRIPARKWWEKQGPPPADKSVQRFFQVFRNPEKYPPPILVHCFAGEHRTGAYMALYRMEFDCWSNEAAVEEMRRCGYVNIDHEWDVRTYLRHFQPSWRREESAAVDQGESERSSSAARRP